MHLRHRAELILTTACLVGVGACGQQNSGQAATADEQSTTQCLVIEAAQSTEPSIQKLASTASAWLNSLDPNLQSQAKYCLGHEEQYTWSNLPPPRSGGLPLAEMNVEQQSLAWQTLRSFLSEQGYDKIHFLATDIEEASGAGPWDAYTFGVFGDPSVDGAWGLQFDGHHIALNFRIHASDVVLSPAFVGASPLSVGGEFPMSDEHRLGRAVVAALSEKERREAHVAGLVQRDVLHGAGRRHLDTNRTYNYSIYKGMGIGIHSLSTTPRSLISDIVTTYVENLSEPFVNKVLERVRPDEDSGYFVYSTRRDRLYYRVYVPGRIWIEYSDVGSDHIHTITRLLGDGVFSDYGLYAANVSSPATLHEHYLASAHHQGFVRGEHDH